MCIFWKLFSFCFVANTLTFSAFTSQIYDLFFDWSTKKRDFTLFFIILPKKC